MLLYTKKKIFSVLFKGLQIRFGGVQISKLFLSTVNTDWNLLTREATSDTMTDQLDLEKIVVSTA